KGAAATAVVTLFGPALAGCATSQREAPALRFSEVEPGPRPDHAVAEGYRASVLVRWGDKVRDSAPAFDVRKQSASAQSAQFGYNCDFVAYAPLPAGSHNSEHGLLWVNHEYTESHMMFPGLNPEMAAAAATRETVDIELAAHGGSLIEIR